MGKFKPKVLFVISQTITTLALITICIYSFINEFSQSSHVQIEKDKPLNSAPTALLNNTGQGSYVNGTILEESNINDHSLIKVCNCKFSNGHAQLFIF